jgi:hypothetical protein
MQEEREHSELEKLMAVARELQRGHEAQENEKSLLKKGLKDLTNEDLDNLNQLKPKLFWSMVKILSEVNPEKIEGKGTEDLGKEAEPLLMAKKTKTGRNREEPCPVCEVMKEGNAKMEREVDKVLKAFKDQQAIDTKNHGWIEDIVREAASLGDFSSSARTDNLTQRPNQKAEEIETMLQGISENVLDIFAVSSVAAATLLEGEPIADKVTAMVILSGKAMWDIDNKRRENLYGRAGATGVKGRRTLTEPTFDSNAAYRNKNFNSSFYNYGDKGTQFGKGSKRARQMEEEGSAAASSSSGWASGFAGRGGGFYGTGNSDNNSNWRSGFGKNNNSRGRSLSTGRGGGFFRGGQVGRGSF